MNVKNLPVKFLIVALLVALSLASLYPPQQKLKPGIDLAGGFSLLYEIEMTSADQGTGLADKVIAQLRKRVDPQNQRNLVWRPVGESRIEVQMPAPSGESRRLRTEADHVIERILALNIDKHALQAYLEAGSEQRTALRNEILAPLNQRLSELKAGSAGDQAADLKRLETLLADRQTLLDQVTADYDQAQQVAAGKVAGNEVEALHKYEGSLNQILATNVERSRLYDVLDMNAGESRTRQLEALREKYIACALELEEATRRYDLWSKDRGLLEGPEDLKRLLRGAGVLEFRILAQRDPQNPSRLDSRNPAYRQEVSDYTQTLQSRGPRYKDEVYRWFLISNPIDFFKAKDLDEVAVRAASQKEMIIEKYGDQYFILTYDRPEYGLLHTADTKWKLTNAIPTRDYNTGRPIVSFQLDQRGGELFGQLTKANINRPMGVFLDNNCMSYAVIQSEIHESGQISGESFSARDVQALVQNLEAGSLPARLKEPPLSERSIGSNIGQANQQRGIKAAIIAAIGVAAFMALYYLQAGIIADIALAMNILFTLAAMAAMEATFTLAGIAGLALSAGMAVDANVLIYERIREELQRGASLKMAVKLGYEKALSAILDCNITTLLSCLILGYVGSEEVKGFAIVLGLGLVFNVFTALFVTRIIFAALIQAGLMKTVRMLKIIGVPDIDWMKLARRYFLPGSVVLIAGSGALFAYEHVNNKPNIYDIEFLGGTAITITLNHENGQPMLNEDEVRQVVSGTGFQADDPHSVPGWLRWAAGRVDDITIKSTAQAGVYRLASPDFTASQLDTIALAALAENTGIGQPRLFDQIEEIDTHEIQVTTRLQSTGGTGNPTTQPAAGTLVVSADEVHKRIQKTNEYLQSASDRLRSAKLQVVAGLVQAGSSKPDTYEINTTETNKDLVREAIVAAIGPKLKIQQPLSYTLRNDPVKNREYFPLYKEGVSRSDLRLADVIGGDALAPIRNFSGGVAMVFENVTPPHTLQELTERFQQAHLVYGGTDYAYRPFELVALSYESTAPANNQSPRVDGFALLVADDEINYEENPEEWEARLAQPELRIAQEALSGGKTLQTITQFAPQIADQSTQQAAIAIILSLVAIALYVWIRFGELSFGITALVALFHDIIISMGAISISYYLSQTLIGRLLLIGDFKIDLSTIAALLTIVGYSINDKIVVFDRIRELRGKLKEVPERLINPSINQTLPRTIVTSTALLSLLVLYIWGGDSIRAFSFLMLLGIFVGTYSSIAIAAPLMLHPQLLRRVAMGILILVSGALGLAVSSSTMSIFLLGVAGASLVAAIWAEIRYREPGATQLTPRVA
ncbi:MAG: hypothetical protein HJJLKODD_02661 [Phycisphaerae bacterium]|nr:hypothetical protein [Phycisphaerae bacterium]